MIPMREDLSQSLPGAIEMALLGNMSVRECAVLVRTTDMQYEELVAYVVPDGPVVLPELQRQIEALLPVNDLACTCVFLLRLPRTTDGEIDRLALTCLPVLDAALAQRWETTLGRLPAVEQVKVMLREVVEAQPRLHLTDLFLERSFRATPAQPMPDGTGAPTAPRVSVTPAGRLAIAHSNALVEDPSAPQTLPALLRYTAATIAGEQLTYLQADGTERTQSYAALCTEAEQILTGLRKQQVQPGNPVLLQLDDNRDLLAAFWGCLLGGFLPVISAVPPSYHETNNDLERLKHVWHTLQPPVIVTSPGLHAPAQRLTHWLPLCSEQIVSIDRLRDNPPDRAYHSAKPGDVAFFSLTSGSTGVPKCIQLTHRNILSRSRGVIQMCGLSRDNTILNWLPFDHIGSISDWHVRSMVLGCRQIIAPREYVLGNPLNWLALLDRYRITHSWAPNFAYSLINAALKEQHGTWDLTAVQSLLTAGESVSPQVVQAFLDNLAPYGLARTAIQPAFGMAEMGSGVTYFLPTPAQPLRFLTLDRDSLGQRVVQVPPEHPNSMTFTSLGPPIPGVTLRIVDEQNQVLPEETVGHFQVKGNPVSPGYYQNDAANRAVFLADGWFNTGDLGFISNGELVLTGRAKESIIINGANYSNSEIESVVETVDGVEVSYTAACAVRLPGRTSEELAIFFSPVTDDREELSRLLQTLRRSVTRRIGVAPHYLIPVTRADIPKTAIGKIQRSRLAQRFEAGDFDTHLKQLDLLLANEQTLPNWFYRKIWRRKKLQGKPVATTAATVGATLIFLDRIGLGQRLQHSLSRWDQPCVLVTPGKVFDQVNSDHYTIDPSNAEHYQRLIMTMTDSTGPITAILHAWNYTVYAGEITHVDALEQAQATGLYSLCLLVQALAQVQGDAQDVMLRVVSSHTQPVLPTDLNAYEKAPLLGLVKTVALEMPWLHCQHLDLPSDDLSAAVTALLREWLTLPDEGEVAYRNGERWVPRLERVAFAANSSNSSNSSGTNPLKPGGLYLLSGGLGGIGTEIAAYLLEQYQARLLIVGRTALPAPADQVTEAGSAKSDALQRLEWAGGELLYRVADICDLERMQQVVAEAEAHWQQKLDGVLHLATAYHERLLTEESLATLAAGLRPKMVGGWVLHQLLKERPAALFIAFSSIASFFGEAGLCGYTAANRFLESLTDYQLRHHVCRSWTFAWSVWDGIGISRSQGKRDLLLRAKGLEKISPKQGVLSWLAGLTHQHPQILIGLDGDNPQLWHLLEAAPYHAQALVAYMTRTENQLAQTMFADQVVRDRFGTPSTCYAITVRPALLAGSDRAQHRFADGTDQGNGGTAAPRTPLEQRLARLWQAVLGVREVDVNADFFELGGDSLKGAQFMNRLQAELGDTLHVVAIFSAPTIADLAAYLEEHYPAAVAKMLGQSHASASEQVHIRITADDVALFRQRLPVLPALPPASGKNPRAVFVLSSGRSGSTLFRVMLAGHPQIFAPPELLLLPYTTVAEREAALVSENSIWREGVLKALTEIKHCTVAAAEEYMRDLAQQGVTIQQFYGMFQQELGDRLLVDKTPLYTMDLDILRRAEYYFEDAMYIHLIRHPYAVIRSFEEARLDQLVYAYLPTLRGEPGSRRFSTRELAELVWLVNQQNILTFLEEIPAARQQRVWFEELVSDPRPVMEGVCRMLGLEFHLGMLEPYAEKQQRMTTGLHSDSRMLGDIKFHQHQGIDAGIAARWKTAYTEDFLGEISWEVAERLGYEQPAPAAPPEAQKLSIPPAPRNQSLPLSFAQERLWFLAQLEGASPTYNSSFAWRIQGQLNVATLERSLAAIIQRHEMLRTTFTLVDGSPAQVIHPPYALPVTRVDLRHLPAMEQLPAAQRQITQAALQPFDLECCPLLRVTLFQFSDEDAILFLVMQHLITDGWSLNIFIHELSEFYTGFTYGQPYTLPTLPIQYADFAVWQRQTLSTQALEEQLRYWKERLMGVPPLLALPTDRPRPPVQSFQGARYFFALPPELSRALVTLSHSLRTTLYMTLLTAFMTLLYRYSGQTDIVVGSPIANRNQQVTESLIGLIVNTLVLRANLGENPSFRVLLGQVRRIVVEAQKNQDLPFEQLVATLRPERSLGYNPLCQVMFTWHNAPRSAMDLPGATVTPFPVERGISRLDLTLNMFPNEDGPTGELEYSSDLFDASTIERMVEHFQQVLAAIVADPDQRIDQLSLRNATVPATVPQAAQPVLTQAELTALVPRLRSGVLPALKLGGAAVAPVRLAVVTSNTTVDRDSVLNGDRRDEAGSGFVPPRDPLELRLVQIWEEVLAIKPVGIRDNFFELGGHSLLAVKMLARIEQHLGRKVPVSRLFEGATIAHLATLLRHQVDQPAFFSLVPLQPDGTHPPLFCVHDNTGQVFSYVGLATHMGKEQPFYGLQAVALDTEQAAHAQVESMAAHYIAAMLTVQPKGPYYLAGRSFGGSVAFEMARQLHAQGHMVALLALLDAYAPALIPDEVLYLDDAAFLMGFMHNAMNQPGDFRQIIQGEQLDQFRQLTPEEQLTRIAQRIRSASNLPVNWRATDIRHLADIAKTNLRAAKQYVPQPYSGRITLLRVDAAIASEDPTLGWGAFAAGGIDIHIVSGTHRQMMQPPFVETIARILTDCMVRVRG